MLLVALAAAEEEAAAALAALVATAVPQPTRVRLTRSQTAAEAEEEGDTSRMAEKAARLMDHILTRLVEAAVDSFVLALMLRSDAAAEEEALA